MFSLESPHRGNSNEYTNIPLTVLKRKSPEIIPNTIRSAAMEFFGKELKNEFEIAAVNKPSVFAPLKFYCIFSPDFSIELNEYTFRGSNCLVFISAALLNWSHRLKMKEFDNSVRVDHHFGRALPLRDVNRKL